MGVVGAAGILVLLAAQAAGDPFTARRDAAAALNPRRSSALTFRRFHRRRRTALIWADHGDQPLSSWLLDRNREFQRVESIARRHGVLLERR